MIKQIYIHPLAWFVVFIAVATGLFRHLILLAVIIFVHEWGHYIMARFFNWRIRRVVLLPFGGVLEVDEHGNRPFKEEFLVVLFGPVQHVWLTGVGLIFFHFELWSHSTLETFLFYNTTIFIFNLLPIWPLDGGKLLFLLFAYFQPFKKAHLQTLGASMLFLVIFSAICIVVFQIYLNLALILLFLLFSIYTEYRHHYYVFLRFLLERLEQRRKAKREKFLPVHSNEKVENIFKSFYKGANHVIVFRFHFKDERELLEAYFVHKKVNATVSQLFRLE